MGTTTYRPTQIAYPLTVTHPTVEVAPPTGGSWRADPELIVRGMTSCAAGQDLGQCVLERKYGYLRHPHELSNYAHPAVNLDGYWVRVRNASGTLWVGQIASERREIFGTGRLNGAPVPAGNQYYVAYEPIYQLRKIYVGQSDWLIGGSVRRQEWVPEVNARDKNRTLVGNRSSSQWSGDGTPCYMFGGNDLWTRRQFIEYLLARFVNLGRAFPTWTLGGTAVDVLGQMTDTIKLPDVATVADLIRELIPINRGLDYFVTQEGTTGLKINVFSLADQAQTFGSWTLPANPDRVEWIVEDALDLQQTELARSVAHKYSTIRVTGKRMVVACSLRPDTSPATLQAGWTVGQQQAYEAGTGNASDDTEEHDAARRQDKYRDVFQRYAAPPGFDPDAVHARPTVRDDGTVSPTSALVWQNVVRRTLSWLPLRTGVNYQAGPPADQGTGELLPPMAWVKDPEAQDRPTPVDTLGMSVGALNTDWGLQVMASPNHLLGLNLFSTTADTAEEAKYDPSTLVMTIAFEADQRLRLQEEFSGGNGSVLEINDDTAELWYLAQGTVVGVSAAGTYEQTSQGYVLRNDVDRLGQLMAGAIARYRQQRGRAVITVAGWQAFQDLIGKVLVMLDDGGHPEEMSAPITSVRWADASDPSTTIVAGFAG